MIRVLTPLRSVPLQNELIARLCSPLPATATLSSACDAASFEWLLKTSLGDDDASPATKSLYQQQQQLHDQQTNAMLAAYLSASDDPYDSVTQLSPASTSSDMSVVELIPSSLSFAEF